MAGNDKKGSLPSFSPTPTLDDLFNGNTTIGRIKSMQCMRDGADPKACAREELKKKQQRYADHASGKDPLPPSESLALRSDIDRLSQVVNPGSQNAWPPNSEAETAYLADKAMAERRAANNIGIAAGSPVFTALPAAGRVLGASENAVEGLAVLNVDIVGALGFGGRGGGRGRSAKPASNEPKTSRSTSPSPKPASPGNGTYVEKAANRGVPNLTESGTLQNLRPGDAVFSQRPVRTLVQDDSGRYWLQSPSGNRITPSGSYDFVTMPDGTIRVARPNPNPEFSTHLGLSGGSDVSYAGSIRFGNNTGPNRGTIVNWTNNSGHYQPPASLNKNAGLPVNLFNSH